jgi:hypothetical protein
LLSTLTPNTKVNLKLEPLRSLLIFVDTGTKPWRSCTHARFVKSLIKNLDDLLAISNDPNAYVIHIQGKCPTRPGAMKKKTTTNYAGEVSIDYKVGDGDDADISTVDWEAVCEKCPSLKAWLTMKGALEEDPRCHWFIHNIREICRLQEGSTHCADPSEEEGLYCAHRLNIVALIHYAFGVPFYYLTIGGTDAMKNVTDNLDPAYFEGTASCLHMSNVTR